MTTGAHNLPSNLSKTIPAMIAETAKAGGYQGALEIILFGSYVPGKLRPSSDIDIAVKMEGPIPPALWATIEERFEESAMPQSVDVVDFHRVTENFQKVITSQGITLAKFIL